MVGGVLLGGFMYYFTSSSSPTATLNDTTFVPYRITSREAISPTSFVLTISPNQTLQQESPPYLHPDDPSTWRYPLWSVEFKQPEVQISRRYTPLPPRDGDDPRDGTLRFYIRTVGGGEMSNYLGRLREGQDAWLRGPHRGFDVVDRLGQRQDVVFLAGGTGVVPGLQAANAVLESRPDTTFRLLWAVRKREELQDPAPPARSWWDRWTTAPSPTQLPINLNSPSPVGRQLAQMKSKYGDRLIVEVAVDEEATIFSPNHIANALLATTKTEVSPSPNPDCALHNQMLHHNVSEFETETPQCGCGPEGGRALFMVSGPDGFIRHYAGSKVWLGGSQTQGPVGGVASRIQAQNAQLKRDWLVLKL